MVASFDDVERGWRVERAEGRSQFPGSAEAVAAAPFHAVFQVASRNLLEIVCENANRLQNQNDRRRLNQKHRDQDRDCKIQLA